MECIDQILPQYIMPINYFQNELFIPTSHEEVIESIGHLNAKLWDFVTPLDIFEEKINIVVSDIRRSGYLLPLRGLSGVGKSTFLNSLSWRAHVPIREVNFIYANKFGVGLSIEEQLNFLIRDIYNIVNQKQDVINNREPLKNSRIIPRFCIVIEYLESFGSTANVDTFFRDLNALLRNTPILIIWQVIEKKDLDIIKSAGLSFSTILFHPTISHIDFTGPSVDNYIHIAKTTIFVFNKGKLCYEFQLNDEDFENILNQHKSHPNQLTIRNYLLSVQQCYRDKVNYIDSFKTIQPRPTEIWFIVLYPGAEDVVSQFVKRSPNSFDEAWDADYRAIQEYATDNSREARWSSDRLSLAISGVLKTKILFLPTNAFACAVLSYAKDVGIDIPNNFSCPPHWYQKGNARSRLSATPLCKQINGETPMRGRGKKGGKIDQALETSNEVFDWINKQATHHSDHPFNHALCLSLRDIFKDRNDLIFEYETYHPYLPNIRPDILINLHNKKTICIEMHYTQNKAPNKIASYCLDKLDNYMIQIERMYDSGQLIIPGL